MKLHTFAAAALAMTSLAACNNLTPDQRSVVGVTGGAAAGLVAARVLEADPAWTLIAALGGAAAGTVVAQNSATGNCAYANGNGSYYTAPCR